MHELGIAHSILEIVRQNVPGPAAVRVVRLRLGPLAGVVAESLEFCFDALIRDSPLERARLEITRVELIARCGACDQASPLDQLTFACPRCGQGPLRFQGGDELAVSEIELEDDPLEVQ